MSKSGKPAKFVVKTKKEPLYARIIKYLMLAALACGGVFWGSVTLLSLFRGAYADFSPPAWVGICMGAGEALVICAMVLAWLRKYVFAFAASLAGTVLYCIATRWFVKTARHELETRVVSNDLLDLDKQYIYRAIPVVVGAVLALVLAVISIVRAVRKKRSAQREKESQPVKSIID